MAAPRSIGAKGLFGSGGGGQTIVPYTNVIPGQLGPTGTRNAMQLQPALTGGPGSSAMFAGDPNAFAPYQGTQVSPTYAGSTDFGALGGNLGTPGVNSAANDYTDNYGNKFRYVNYGDGRGEWLQVTSNGTLARPQDAAEIEKRSSFQPTQGANIQGSRNAGNVGATPDNNFFTPAGGARSVVMNAANMGGPQGGQSIIPQAGGANPQQQYNDLLNDYTQSDNNWYAGQTQRDSNYLDQMGGIVNGANAADSAALGKYNSIADQQMANIGNIQAPEWQNYASNPGDVARQQSSYDWASGVQGGSLDYTADQASLTRADYQTATQTMADYQEAQLYLAQLHQYASDPADIAAQQDVVDRLKEDLDSGSKDQREVMEKYKALSDPTATAQERYLAEIARRSFESQDRSNREAVQQDLAMRGLRSGGAEIAGNQAAQERLGQDRTLAELGLQANAIGRSMQAMGGWQQSADSIRGMDQNAMGMLGNQVNAIRGMNDAVGMFNTHEANENEMFNANASNQNSQFNANAYNQNSMFNAGQANQISMFNADAFNSNSQFNAGQANQTSQFNALQNNNAYANNQSTRLQGGIQAGNMANQIRGQNDAVGMFNTEGAQTSKQFAAQLGVQKANTISNIGNQQFTNTTGVTATNAGRSAGLAATNWQVPSATEEQQRLLREQEINRRGLAMAGGADPMPSRSFPIPGMGV